MNVIDKFLQEKLLLESEAATFNGYYIYVNSKDSGNLPHFHIKDISTDGKKFHTCIQIDKNNYFRHEGKQSIFTSIKDRVDLNKLLRSAPNHIPNEIKSTEPKPKTIWEVLKRMWNAGPRQIYVTTSIIPNYTTINLER